MNKKIWMYSFIYLSAYILVVIVSLIFQWGYICNFEISTCTLKLDKLNSILQTSAPIITPIVLIWGYFSWKEQELYKTSTELLSSSLTQTNEIFKAWKSSRYNSDTYSRFAAYCFKENMPINPEILDNSEMSKKELERIKYVYSLLSDLYFTLNHLFIVNKKLNLDNIFKAVDAISSELEQNIEELSKFQYELFCIKNNYTNDMTTQEQIKKICHKLDSSSLKLGSHDEYNDKINNIIQNVTAQINTLSSELN